MTEHLKRLLTEVFDRGYFCGAKTESVREREHALEQMLREVLETPKPYVYDCDRGQGLVMARSLEQAESEALKDCGRSDPPRNVREATEDELAFRGAMGGTGLQDLARLPAPVVLVLNTQQREELRRLAVFNNRGSSDEALSAFATDMVCGRVEVGIINVVQGLSR